MIILKMLYKGTGKKRLLRKLLFQSEYAFTVARYAFQDKFLRTIFEDIERKWHCNEF